MNTNQEIVLYGRKRFCPDVRRTRTRLGELGLSWTEHDIEADETAAARVERLTGRRQVPTLVIGERVLVEPSNDELDEALQSAGHKLPATAGRKAS